MESKSDEFNQAKGRIVSDIKAVITDGEDLIKAAAHVSAASVASARNRLDQKFNGVKAQLMDASRPALDRAKKTACAADKFVHGSPWTAIGAVAAAALILGVLASWRGGASGSRHD